MSPKSWESVGACKVQVSFSQAAMAALVTMMFLVSAGCFQISPSARGSMCTHTYYMRVCVCVGCVHGMCSCVYLYLITTVTVRMRVFHVPIHPSIHPCAPTHTHTNTDGVDMDIYAKQPTRKITTVRSEKSKRANYMLPVSRLSLESLPFAFAPWKTPRRLPGDPP